MSISFASGVAEKGKLYDEICSYFTSLKIIKIAYEKSYCTARNIQLYVEELFNFLPSPEEAEPEPDLIFGLKLTLHEAFIALAHTFPDESTVEEIAQELMAINQKHLQASQSQEITSLSLSLGQQVSLNDSHPSNRG